MKPELMKNWIVVQNGRRIDIHAFDPTERREITVVADVRDHECAALIANAPKYQTALLAIVDSFKPYDGELVSGVTTRMHAIACAAIGTEQQESDCETTPTNTTEAQHYASESIDKLKRHLQAVSNALRDAISTYGPKAEIIVTSERQEAWAEVLRKHGL